MLLNNGLLDLGTACNMRHFALTLHACKMTTLGSWHWLRRIDQIVNHGVRWYNIFTTRTGGWIDLYLPPAQDVFNQGTCRFCILIAASPAVQSWYPLAWIKSLSLDGRVLLTLDALYGIFNQLMTLWNVLIRSHCARLHLAIILEPYTTAFWAGKGVFVCYSWLFELF